MAFHSPLSNRSILLLIGGGIAAYKCLDLIRRLRERGANVRVGMTRAAQEFVTPGSVQALSGSQIFTDLWDRDAEHDVGHIRLAREADLIIVAPATADLMGKMANGLADDLPTTILLAASSPILVAPAMNPAMWAHPAVERNVERLQADGLHFIGPGKGEMAESGEAGWGRMAEPMEIIAAAENLLDDTPKPLSGRRAIVTSGPTREEIDPVRYISNHSSGKQGHAIASALAKAGAEVILISGPVSIPDPADVTVVNVNTAAEMLTATQTALPADIGIFVAAVADWRAERAEQKIKKEASGLPLLKFTENPDILATISKSDNRPALVVGFAAETENLEENARTKLARKGCDWVVANNVTEGVFGTNCNDVTLVKAKGTEKWPAGSKDKVANQLVERIITHFTATEI